MNFHYLPRDPSSGWHKHAKHASNAWGKSFVKGQIIIFFCQKYDQPGNKPTVGRLNSIKTEWKAHTTEVKSACMYNASQIVGVFIGYFMAWTCVSLIFSPETLYFPRPEG